MAAITWRELMGAPDTGAFRALGAAGSTLNAGFDAFDKVINARQAANQYQYDKGQDAQSLAYREALAGATSEEQVKAIQAQRDALLAGLDPVRRAQLVGAEEARLGSVRTNIEAAQKFAADQLLQQHLPTLNEARAAYARGDKAIGDSIMAKVPGNVKDYWRYVSEGHKDAEARETHGSQIENDATTRALHRAQETVAREQAASIPKELQLKSDTLKETTRGHNIQLLDRNSTLLSNTSQKLSELQNQSFGGVGGLNAVLDRLQKSGVVDKARLPKVSSWVGEAISSKPTDPEIVKTGLTYDDLPTAVVEKLVTKYADNMGSWYDLTRWAGPSDLKRELDAALKDKDIQKQIAARELQKSILLDQQKQHRMIGSEVERSVLPSIAEKLDAAAAAAAKDKKAPAAAPAAAPGVPDPLSGLLAKQATLEIEGLRTGKIEKLSPEVQTYLEQEAQKTNGKVNAARETLIDLVKQGARGVRNMPMFAATGMALSSFTDDTPSYESRQAQLKAEIEAAKKAR
jgi:uncharacterized protein YidB (DUF937 family)